MVQFKFDKRYAQGRCSGLFSTDPTERVVFSTVNGLPYARRTGFDRTLPGRVSDMPEVGNRYSSGLQQREAEHRVIQQSIICRFCRGIGKDTSHYQDLPEMKECES
jgi:hypothetical protein